MSNDYWDAKDKKISRQWSMNVATQIIIGQNQITQKLNAAEVLEESKKLAAKIMEWLNEDAPQ